ncbi:TraU family protein [Vibrio parahaemolyticus]|nr:TraU family protein [Vibrio parahaemolyticus]EJG0009848.1 TraU family protein [Vibrio parahaemolyticus]
MIKLIKSLAVAILTGAFAFGNANAGGMDSQCPDSEYFSGLMTDICWTCSLPISLFGLTDPPPGANEDFMCACDNELGIPIPGFAVGFFQPDQIMEVSTIPYCSPTLGGIQLSNDYTHIGTPLDQKDNGEYGGDDTNEKAQLVQYHYNYLASPVLKMMQVLAIPECDKNPGTIDLDIMFMSPLTIEWYDDLMSFVLNPDAVAFANPIGQAMCMYDCAETMISGVSSEANWHCAGCDGSLYPLTGNISGAATNPIQASSLVTTRAIAKTHRLGLSARTLGKDAMCEYVYSPMIPKAQYKMQLAFPIPQASGTCCQALGDNWLKWGLGRTAPGGGKDTTFVYNIFRYADCCIPFM